ncbi:alanine racemase [Pontibacter chitinilyticus]|uniref:alanine racemase n=1 Tax=Pontibacter chitinilyticus TaxID=2674989 RepID=UPI003219B78D
MRITTPTLLLDKEKCLRNIRRMVEKASRNNVRLRPHFKTHQSAQIGEWFREMGVGAITVSSLRMASYFANHGWADIMVAFPANVLEIDRINELAPRIQLHLLAVNQETVELLAAQLKYPVHIWVKIDTGYRRTGILPHSHAELDSILTEIKQSDKLHFSGFVVHDGHTYKQTDIEAVRTIHNTSVYQLQLLKERYKGQFPQLQLSIGDTPSCSIVEHLSGVDEIRPGNFVFFDLTQQRIGSCTFQDIAVSVACPVVAKHADRGELILYGGSVHFSKESLPLENGSVIYGRGVELNGEGWGAPIEGLEIVSLSQEHSIVKASPEQFEKYHIGDLLLLLPVHSCLTADLMRGYLTLNGERLEHLSGVPQQEVLF